MKSEELKTERIEALEKKVAELSRKVSVEAPLSVREAYAWASSPRSLA